MYIEENAKEDLPLNAGANGLIKALIQYGNSKNRLVDLQREGEVQYTSEKLDQGLIQEIWIDSSNNRRKQKC